MADIVDEAPKEKRTAKKVGKAIHITEEIGPQQLMMPGDANPIGTRISKTIDIVKLVEVERFLNGIRSTRDNLKNQIVGLKQQEKALSDLGAQECGPILADILTEARKLANTDKAWQKFQRKMFKPIGGGNAKGQPKQNVIVGTLNQWQKYKQIVVQIENIEKQLVRAEEHLDVIESVIAGNGTPAK